MPVLVVAGDAGGAGLVPATRLIPFQSALLIGRRPPVPEPDAAAWAVRDACASSLHARIVATGAGHELHDLGSRNGTCVDGVPVRGPTPLRDGALIFIGLHVVVFRTVTARALAAMQRELVAPFGPVATVSPALALLGDRLRRLAPGDGELLLCGETGVGKEVYARAIHRASGRTGRFVAINCAAVPGELVESELYGHVRGAHSEALERKRGLVEEAEGGTLFLDEIGEMAPELQAKLLRFTQDRLVTPLGATQARRVDVRIIAATNRAELVDHTGAGVRRDLAARLGETLRLPPLREHVEDVGALAAALLGLGLGEPCGRSLQPAALRALCLHDWPGNVRELHKVLHEADVLSGGGTSIDLEHLPRRIAERRVPEIARGQGGRPPPPGPTELERLLRRHRGNMTHVARELERDPALVYRWASRFRLDPAAFRDRE